MHHSSDKLVQLVVCRYHNGLSAEIPSIPRTVTKDSLISLRLRPILLRPHKIQY